MNKIYILIIIIFIASCSQRITPVKNNKTYTVNVLYIEDTDTTSLQPKTFLDIFKQLLPQITYNMLGYKIQYNLITSTSADSFYRQNRKKLKEVSKIIKKNYLNVNKLNENELNKYITKSLSDDTRYNLQRLFKSTNVKQIANTKTKIIKDNINKVSKQLNIEKKDYLLYSDVYWKAILPEIEEIDIIVVNTPIVASSKNISVKNIADNGIIDRLVLYNENIMPTKAIAIVSIYPLLSNEIINKLDYKTVISMFSYYIVQTVAMLYPKYDIHEFENHSIMAEVKDFDYYTWYNNIINFELKQPYKTISEYKDNF